MDQQQKSTLRARALEEMATTELEIERLKEQIKPIAPDNAIGRLTRMEAINARGVNQSKLANAEKKLQKLKRVLELLAKPSFGSCLECGEDIPMDRLLLVPETRRCVDCG